MATPSSHLITQLLADWRNGDRAVLDRLMPLVYEELRRPAHYYLRQERPDHTLPVSEKSIVWRGVSDNISDAFEVSF